MVGSRSVSNDLIFSDVIMVDIQLVVLLLISNISKLSIGAKSQKLWYYLSPVKYILLYKQS